MDSYKAESIALSLERIIEVRNQAEFNAAAKGNPDWIRVLEGFVEARGSAHVVAWGSAHVEAWGNTSTFLNSGTAEIHNGVVIAASRKGIKLHPLAVFKKLHVSENFLHDIKVSRKKTDVVLFKKVSHEYKTQENTKNETLWIVGSAVEHQNWNPAQSECGEGKFHACARPYFCDDFRSEPGDRYVAIQVAVADLYEWKNPQYPHKIAFRKGKVLYECDWMGEKLAGGGAR